MTSPTVRPPHSRLTITWRIGNPTDPIEEASINLNIAGQDPDDPSSAVSSDKEVRQAAVERLFTGPIATFTADSNNGLANDTSLWSVKYAVLGADGKYAVDAVTAYVVGAPVYGTGIRTMPLQIATTVSLRTAKNGPRGRGRVYLPTGKLAIGAGGLMPAEQALGIANSFVTMLNGIAADAEFTTGDQRVSVLSTYGLRNPVTSVAVGRAPDTMRSRRRNVQEDYRLATNLIDGA